MGTTRPNLVYKLSKNTNLVVKKTLKGNLKDHTSRRSLCYFDHFRIAFKYSNEEIIKPFDVHTLTKV